MKPTIALWLLILSSVVYAQDNAVDWINENAHELNTGSTYQDLFFLSKVLKDKPIIGLGEASHGTQEFYFQKRRIASYLISQHKYRIVAFESVTTYVEPINTYIQTGEGDLKSMLKPLVLYNTEEIYKLFEWLKEFNKSKSPQDRVKLIGFDDEEFWGNPLKRDEQMAGKFISAHSKDNHKSILWSHNVHLAKDTTMAQYKAMGFHLKKKYGNQYYAIGFDTHHGSVSVLNNDREIESRNFDGTENTFTALFSKAKFEAFFVDFHKVPNPFINTVNSITNIFSEWRGEPKPLPIVPGADFDGLIFIRETTASKAVK